MANIKSAKKRARQGIKRRAHNMALRSRFRTYLKKVDSAIEAGDKSAAHDALKTAQPLIDSMATKGIIHKNKAARHKGRLTKRVQAMS